MNIRYGKIDDAAMLAALGAESFRDAYVGQIKLREIDVYIKEAFSHEKQSSELSDPNSIFLLVETDRESVGYAKLTMNASNESIEGRKPVEIARIYLLQTHKGRGLGSELIRSCINEALRRGCDSIWLGVWQHNERAIAFYKKWGFKEVGVQTFRLGEELQRDLIMELRI